MSLRRPGGTGLETQTSNSITSNTTTSSTITTTMSSLFNTTITSSTHPPFDPSAASESECSEHPADGSSSKQLMERKKIRKKKTLDRFPKLTVLSVTDTMVECQLETIKQKTITFKFDITDNDPQDVANKLVRNFRMYHLYLSKFHFSLESEIKLFHYSWTLQIMILICCQK